MTYKDKTPEIRQRLLAAAGEVFAERGFRDATTREICERASANVAAVNYHFGEKEELYRAVFEYAHAYAPRMDEAALAAGSTEQQLRVFIHTALTRLFHEGRPAWLGRLVAQEMINPTNMLDGLVAQQIRPNLERLKTIVRAALPPESSDETLRLCTNSVAAQWLFYFHSGQVIKRLNPEQQFSPSEIQLLAEHITKFSITALKGLRA